MSLETVPETYLQIQKLQVSEESTIAPHKKTKHALPFKRKNLYTLKMPMMSQIKIYIGFQTLHKRELETWSVFFLAKITHNTSV